MATESKGWWEDEVLVLRNQPSQDRAMLVQYEGEKVWIPYSQIESPDPEEVEENETITLLIPDWLAVEKGMA